MRCEGCQRPILPGEARYTGGEGADPPRYWHWDCHELKLNEWKDALRRLPELFGRVRDTLRKIR